MMNAPPPFLAACTGKRKKFPSPTALPATANIKPILVDHSSLCDIELSPFYIRVGKMESS